MKNKFPLFVRTVTGLEEVLAKELSDLGAEDIQVNKRGVFCTGDRKLIYQVNLWSRVAIRVLRLLTTFAAVDEKALYDGVQTVDWSEWISENDTLAVGADVRSSFATHSLFISQLVKDAVVDQFRDKTGVRPSVDLKNPKIRIVLSLFQNTAQVYVDASGDSLHKRGYRQKTGEAPISEVLAAGIIKLSGWDGKTPLIDPMAGSGTFCIEAALIQKNIAPGLTRKQFGFMTWPDYEPELYQSLVSKAKEEIHKDIQVPILSFDIDPEVVKIANENIERAGLKGEIEVLTGDFFTWDKLPEKFGTVVINPPYDERLPLENVVEFYQKMGDRLRVVYGGWAAHIISGNLEAVKAIGLRSSKRTLMFNGSLECRLMKFEIREGNKKTEGPKWRETIITSNPEFNKKAEIFSNRLQKNIKHYSKWTKREGVTSFRVYDRDIPEFPFIVDKYGENLYFGEIPRNQELGGFDHLNYMKLMVKTAADLLSINSKNVYYKVRRQIEIEKDLMVEIEEAGLKYWVNLAEPIDLGFSLELRNLRALIKKEAQNKDVLNLYAKTGTFTVCAAKGGASSTCTVDASKSKLPWAEKNLKLNMSNDIKHKFIREDAYDYLKQTRSTFDICLLDPPVRSLQEGQANLIRSVLSKIKKDGSLYFFTSIPDFELDSVYLNSVSNLKIKNITTQMTPIDFERKPTYQYWRIVKES